MHMGGLYMELTAKVVIDAWAEDLKLKQTKYKELEVEERNESFAILLPDTMYRHRGKQTLLSISISDQHDYMTIEFEEYYAGSQVEVEWIGKLLDALLLAYENRAAVIVEIDWRLQKRFAPQLPMLSEKELKKYNWLFKKERDKNQIFFKTNDEKRFEEVNKKANAIKSAFLKMRATDELFKHRYPEEGNRLSGITYYHQGQQGTLNFEIDGERIRMYESKGTFDKAIDGVEKIEGMITAYFDRVYKSKRLQNVFSAPTHHFDKHMSTCVRYKDLHKPIYAFLTEHHLPEELEKRFAKAKRNRMQSTKTNPQFGILRILDYILVLDNYQNKIYDFAASDLEAAKAKFEELNLVDLKKEVQEKLVKLDG
jgi:hypothetical protein